MANTKKHSGEISWTASEYVEHSRGPGWYLALVVIAAALAFGTYLITHDFFGVAIILVLGAITGSTAHWKPNKLEYRLDSKGMTAGEKFYPYTGFKAFSIVAEGELKSLVLLPTKKFATAVNVFIDEDQEEKITELLGEHLPMVESGPDRIEVLSRRLRF